MSYLALPPSTTSFLDPSNAGIASDRPLHIAIANRRHQVGLMLGEFLQHNHILPAWKRTRVSQWIQLASSAEIAIARRIRNIPNLARRACFGEWGHCVFSSVAFDQDSARGRDVEVVAGVGGEPIIHRLDELSSLRAANLGRAARQVVQVVAIKGDLVGLATNDDGPVMIAVAAVRVGRAAVEFGVGDGYSGAFIAARLCQFGPGENRYTSSTRGSLLRNKVLAACAADLAVIDPNTVISGQADAIAAPDILRVKILSQVSCRPYSDRP